MKFLGVQVNETPPEAIQEENPIKSFDGVILEKYENELIIGSKSNNTLKMRLIITEKNFLPNMSYPSLCDKMQRSITLDQISIRDRILLEFDNKLKEDTNVPINASNSYIRVIDLDIKDRI